jgi:hypothetical protein
MRVNSAVLLVLFLLVGAAGWLAAGAASPNTVTLLMGVAIGMIISMPVTLVVARLLWSDQERVIRRPARRAMDYPYDGFDGYEGYEGTGMYPPIIVVPSATREVRRRAWPTYPDEDAYEPPAIHYLGEE